MNYHCIFTLLFATSLAPAANLVQFTPVIPITFEANQGQLDLPATHLAPDQSWAFDCSSLYGIPSSWSGPAHFMRLSLLRPGSACQPELARPTNAVAHYYRGANRAAWLESIPRSQSLLYRNVATGLDWRYQGNIGIVEWQWAVAAGIDPSTFTLRLENDSNFFARTPAPVATQLGQTLPAHWEFNPQTGLAFLVVDNRIPSAPLTVTIPLTPPPNPTDPLANAKATRNPAGNWFVLYPTFGPTTLDRRTQACFINGPANEPCPAIAAARFSPSGELLSITYLIGSLYSAPNFARTDLDGNFYIAGITFSPDFPVTENAVQPLYAGPVQPVSGRLYRGGDVVLAKLYGPTGGLISSTFAGTAANDIPASIDIDISGRPTLLLKSAVYSGGLIPTQQATIALRLNESFSSYDINTLAENGTSIRTAPDGTAWILHYDSTLDHLTPNGVLIETLTSPNALSIASFTVTANSTLWFSCMRFNGQFNEPVFVRYAAGVPELLPNMPLGILEADKQGNVSLLAIPGYPIPETLPPVTSDAILPKPCAELAYYARFKPEGPLSFATFLSSYATASYNLDSAANPILDNSETLTAIDLAAPPTNPVACPAPLPIGH